MITDLATSLDLSTGALVTIATLWALALLTMAGDIMSRRR